MQALLLLAGRSTRFWPLTEKTLFPILGKTLLEHQINHIKKGGCRDIVLVGGAHNLKEAKEIAPMLPIIEQEDPEGGMRGALLSALPLLKDEPLLVVSGNDVTYPDAYALLQKESGKPGIDGVILARRVTSFFPGGYLTLQQNRVTEIVEKPEEGKEPGDLVNIVAHVHNRPSALLHALGRVGPPNDDGYERALQLLFPTHTYHAVIYDGPWQAVKYPWHIAQLLPLLLNKITERYIHRSAVVHPTAVIEGNVFLDEEARVLPHAVIQGPCFIGKKSVIATGALVRSSSIGAHSVIGFGSEVARSVLHSHVWTHMTYIGDSVIGRNVSFGAGSVTANFRLDEQEVRSEARGKKISTGLQKFGTVIGNDCRIGIHASINPGIKIGGGSFIGSHALVHRDIPERSFVSFKNGALSVVPNVSTPPKGRP